MVDWSTMAKRLEWARQTAKPGLSKRQAAIRMGVSPSTYAAHENEQNGYGPEDAKRYAQFCGVRSGWLLTGEGDPFPDKKSAALRVVPLGREFSADPPMPTPAGVPELDVRTGMGAGGNPSPEAGWTDYVKEERWQFPTSFVREELRAPTDRLLILETQGDSMTPTIAPGERIIVDTGHKIPSPDGIYALRDRFGFIVAKRLQVMRSGEPPVIKIISDNPAHQSESVRADEIEIVGRVICGLKRY